MVELKKLLKYDGSNSIKHKAAITAALITLLALVSFGGAVRAEAGDAFRDLEGKCVAVQTGTISGEVALSVIPDLEVNYFNTQTDCLAALRAGKVDAWASDEPMIRFLMIDNPDLIMYGDKLDESSLAAVFAKSSKGQALCDEYSAFVDELWANGTMAEIDAAWFGTDEDKRTVLDYDEFSVTTPDASRVLPKKEFLLLFKLLSYPGKIFTRRQLMDELWDMDSDTDERTVDVHIRRLREKIESNPSEPKYVHTKWGVGYYFLNE